MARAIEEFKSENVDLKSLFVKLLVESHGCKMALDEEDSSAHLRSLITNQKQSLRKFHDGVKALIFSQKQKMPSKLFRRHFFS